MEKLFEIEAIQPRTADKAVSNGTSAQLAIAGSVIIWLVLLAMAPTLLRYVFVGTSFLCAVYLFSTNACQYVSFIWWLYFLTPLFRRLVDYRAGFDPTSLMLAAPLFATSVCCFEFTRLRALDARSTPFVLLAMGAGYGFIVSAVAGNPMAVCIQYFLTWISPAAFGYFLYLHWAEYPDFRANVQKTFSYGLFVMGVYGIIQYFYAPVWDVLWMENLSEKITSFGTPVPMGIRVFSTMNAPQVFGLTIVAGLLFTLHGPRSLIQKLGWVAGYVGLLLSMARSAWLEWGVALLALAVLTRSRKALTTILAAVLVMGGVTIILTRSAMGENLVKRFETFNNLNDDGSGQERLTEYEQVLGASLMAPFGEGWQLESLDNGEISLHDSTAFELLMCTGWFGLATFYVGVISALFMILTRVSSSQERFFYIIAAILIGLLVETVFNSLMGGAIELGLMTLMGIGLSESQVKEALP